MPLATAAHGSILANWDFNEPWGTVLSQTVNSTGGPTWDRDLGSFDDGYATSYTNGAGAFSIMRWIETNSHSYAALPLATGTGKYWKVIDISSWFLNPDIGPSTEEVYFGFIYRPEATVLNYAEIRIRRLTAQGSGTVLMRGIAQSTGNGATPIPEQAVFSNDRRDQPLRLVLEIDTNNHQYSIYYRESPEGYVFFGSGNLDAARNPTHLRLSAINNFSHDSEHVNIDRIFVTTENPIDTILNPPATGFGAWISGYFPSGGENAAPDADPDGDGLSNLLEYAFGLDPLVANRQGGPEARLGSDRLQLKFRRNLNADDVNYRVLASVDLLNWTEIAAATGGASFVLSGAGGIEVEAEGDVEVITIADAENSAGAARRFLKLEVTLPGN
jgi:hypothetical protein